MGDARSSTGLLPSVAIDERAADLDANSMDALRAANLALLRVVRADRDDRFGAVARDRTQPNGAQQIVL